jgi:hypothetical protein
MWRGVRGQSARTWLSGAVMTAVDKPEIDPHAPLRLSRAAEIAFPGGGMTASGLRREAAKGRLAIERIAGKDFTTLAAIEDMRTKCVQHPLPSQPASGSNRLKEAAKPSGPSKTADVELALAVARETARQLRTRSRSTSAPSIQKAKARVIQFPPPKS